MKKVQTTTVRGAVLFLALTLGCEEPSESDPSSAWGRFGSPYEIVTNELPAMPDEPPAILSDSLSVMVSYPGGCAEHDFELSSTVTGDSAQVWLRHDDSGDDCEGLISDRLMLALPPGVLDAQRISLLNPNADVPFVLRWPPASTRGRTSR